MSSLYKADAGNFTREQLIELINHQTQLHVEGQAILIVAKNEIQSLRKELETTKKLLEEALDALRDIKVSHPDWSEEIADEALAKLSKGDM